ncbi:MULTISPECIES: ABC transporter ATP-binding protein [Bacillus]|uniref:ABC transporter ATP-binding protein n=1 Tax=Bacillus glycinifermentans TaxID=1664069 RepID=A0AAJ3Z2B9_9BACI|nr:MULTISPECIES: ABC transporter ATP-binding protein [Bacillus]KKB73713.1 iron-dicitrate transporter ATP-binding subunit [Bacillus sp. TH008]MDU0072392.1 ABC transporter ATP-binding protein [Bacillus sp. IG6]MED8020185.1 ABC transporter ATP-binding protein [Bacillus glycinifermentans]QAT67735.1 ABC transporter ATP-binding protein [Bacillus glycinifermentans]WKB79587.1 ABC transporter ATP-binding protein [Bacillus glycinifermentans]
MKVKLSAQKLTLSYDTSTIINEIDLEIPEGKISVLIGSNGCGKSTILKSLARIMAPESGSVYLDGKEIHRQPSKEIAKKMAILPQSPQAPEGLTVEELCYFGRHPHKKLLSRHTKEDHEMVDWALEATGMAELRSRTLDALSGGQRQRAWISMSLAQGTDLLLLDEPTTFLDIAHQIEVLELLKHLNRDHGRTIVMVLHDLNQASQYADYLISILDGKVYSAGAPEEVFTPSLFRDVFGLECCIMKSPVDQKPMCLPTGLCGRALAAAQNMNG